MFGETERNPLTAAGQSGKQAEADSDHADL